MKTNFHDSSLDYFHRNYQITMNIIRRLLHLLQCFDFNFIF